MKPNSISVIEAPESLRHLEDLISAELRALLSLPKRVTDALAKLVIAHVSKMFGGQGFVIPSRPEQHWESPSAETASLRRLHAPGTGARVWKGLHTKEKEDQPLWMQMFEAVKALVCSELKAESGVEEWRAASVADQVAWTFLDHYRGQNIYVPKDQRRLVALRNEMIVKRIVHESANSLAREFGISRVRVYQIVNKAKQSAVRRGSTHAQSLAPPPLTLGKAVIYRTTTKQKERA